MLVETMTMPAVNDLIKKSFLKQTNYRPAGDVRQLFHKEPADWTSKYKRIKEVDRDRFAERKAEGAPSAQRGVSEGYAKQIERNTISVTRKVTGEAYKALTAHGLAKMSTQVADDVVDKAELDMRNFVGYGDSSSYTDNGGFTIDTTVGDGNPFFYSTHTLKNASATYSNILSGAPSLGDSSLESAEDFFAYNIMDNNSQRLKLKPNTIITTNKPTMVNRVARMLKSTSPESIEGAANTNAGVTNTNKGKYSHLALELDVDAEDKTDSTKSFYWYLAALGSTPESSLQAYYVGWLSPQVAPAERDQDAWILSFTARACYGIGAVSGKGIIVSKASS